LGVGWIGDVGALYLVISLTALGGLDISVSSECGFEGHSEVRALKVNVR